MKGYKTSQRGMFHNSGKLKQLTDCRFEIVMDWNTIFLRGNYPASRMPKQFSFVWMQYRRAGKIPAWKWRRYLKHLYQKGFFFSIQIQKSWICTFPEIYSRYLNICPQYIVRSSTEIIPVFLEQVECEQLNLCFLYLERNEFKNGKGLCVCFLLHC